MAKSRGCCCSLSARARIEEAISDGEYLGFREAIRRIRPAEQLFADKGSDWDPRRSKAMKAEQQLAAGQGEEEGPAGVLAQVGAELRKMCGLDGGPPAPPDWRLAPLMLERSGRSDSSAAADGLPAVLVELELPELEAQIESTVHHHGPHSKCGLPSKIMALITSILVKCAALHQVESIVGRHQHFVEARRRIEALSLEVVSLAAGEWAVCEVGAAAPKR